MREPDDYYTTPSWAVRRLLEAWTPPDEGTVVEPSAGNGAIIKACSGVIRPSRWLALEIREEARGELQQLCSTVIEDFLRSGARPDPAVTVVMGNPPFSKAFEFVVEAQRRFPRAEICYLLRLAFAASDGRNEFMRRYPPDVYVIPDRISFTGEGADNSEYGWFLWPNEVRPGRFQVLKTTPLAERQQDRGHRVMIEPAQRALFG